MQIVINILLVIHVLVSLLIVLFVLMQRPKNEGLGAAFGGGMTENLFGAQTTNVLQTITRWLGFIFFALTLTLSILYVKAPRKSGLTERLGSLPAPVAPTTPAPAPDGLTPGQPAAASAPVTPGEPLPAPAPAPAPAPDAKPEAKPDAPAPAAEKAPEKPADEAPAK